MDSLKLSDLCKIVRGERITKTQLDPNGTYDVWSGGVTPMGKFGKYNREPNVTTVAQYGSAGYVEWHDKKFWANDVCYTLYPYDNVIGKYLYYAVKNQEELLYKLRTDAVPACLPLDVLQSIKIPVPPLPIQEEIVRILDTFTELKAELDAELDARKKQYTFYRDKLLAFDTIIPLKKMGELGVFYGGLTGKSKDDFKDGNAKFITYVNIFKNSALDLTTEDKVKISENEKQNKVLYGDVLFTGSSETRDECGMSSVVTQQINEDMYLNSFCFGYRVNDKTIFDPGFLKHLFRSSLLRKQIVKTANGVTRFNVSKEKMKQIEIPVPPMNIQKRLSYVLDNFDTICSDLSIGLPAEIAAREKQYEYYRDLLFDYAANGLDLSRAEQSRAEQSRAEQSRAEQSRAEQSRAEQS